MATSIDPTSCRAAGKRVVSVAKPSLYEQRTRIISKLSLPQSGRLCKNAYLTIHHYLSVCTKKHKSLLENYKPL